jgi:hypothetical protein
LHSRNRYGEYEVYDECDGVYCKPRKGKIIINGIILIVITTANDQNVGKNDMSNARKYFCKGIIWLLSTAVKRALHIHPIINHRYSKLTFRSLANVLEVSMAYAGLYPLIYPGWALDDYY